MSEYYRIALVAHVACEQGNAMWPVYEELKLAGHAVEVLDPQVDPRLLDAHGSPDLGYLAKFVEVFLPHCIAHEGQGASDILAVARASAPAPDAQRARHVVVFGYLGQDNFGDELIFEQICRKVRGRYPGAWVTAVSFACGSCLERHGTACIPYSHKAQLAASLNGADVLLFMAGIMADSSFERYGCGLADFALNPGIEIGGQAAACLLAYASGVPALALGIGAGPLANPDAQALVRLAALTGVRYVGRDQHTCDLLAQAGVPGEQLCCKADLAFTVGPDQLVALPAELADAVPYVAVSLRERDDLPGQHVCPPDFTRAVAAGLDRLWSSHGIRPVLVDLDPADVTIHREVVSLMEHGEQAIHLHTRELDQTLAILAGASMVVAMRLHASIVANSFGVPSIGFSYEDKVSSFYQQMGREDCLFPMTVGVQEFERFVDEFAGDLLGRTQALQEPITQNRQLADEAFDLLWQVMVARHAQATPQYVYGRSVSTDQRELGAFVDVLKHDLVDARRERDAARGELDGLRNDLAASRDELARIRDDAKNARQEVEDIRASHSWRIGNALMRPLAALKRHLGR